MGAVSYWISAVAQDADQVWIARAKGGIILPKLAVFAHRIGSVYVECDTCLHGVVKNISDTNVMSIRVTGKPASGEDIVLPISRLLRPGEEVPFALRFRKDSPLSLDSPLSWSASVTFIQPEPVLLDARRPNLLEVPDSTGRYTITTEVTNLTSLEMRGTVTLTIFEGGQVVGIRVSPITPLGPRATKERQWKVNKLPDAFQVHASGSCMRNCPKPEPVPSPFVAMAS